MEFGEEHFVDLRLEADKNGPTSNDMGQPSAEWSYKKTTIGTYALEPDFRYTEQVAHDVDATSDSAKLRALKLNGYKVNVADYDPDHPNVARTTVWLNGWRVPESAMVTTLTSGNQLVYDKTVAGIADLTDNGTVVEVYVSETNADFITDIVIIKTELMEVKRMGSDYVTLARYDGKDPDDVLADGKEGFNQIPSNVAASKMKNVEDDNTYYEFLKGLKVGDAVAVVPVSDSHADSEYTVWKAYTPEKVEGKLTRATTYGSSAGAKAAIAVTVGGTSYDIALWNAKSITGLTAEKIEVTNEDVTLLLDEFGNAFLAKGVGDTTDFMIIKGYYSSLVNNRLATFVDGWDISGKELSLNLGYQPALGVNMVAGNVVRYTNVGAANGGDWKLLDNAGAWYGADNDNNTDGVNLIDTTDSDYEIKASNVRVNLVGSPGNTYVAKGVKFIYVNFGEDDTTIAKSIEIKNGVQNVKHEELISEHADKEGTPITGALAAQACYDSGDNAVKAVVIKQESNDAISSNLLYIRDYLGSEGVDAAGKRIYGYTVAMMSTDGLNEEVTIYSDKRLERDSFASYSLSKHDEFEPFYTLKEHNFQYKTTSTTEATLYQVLSENEGLIEVADYTAAYGGTDTAINTAQPSLGIGNEENVLRVADAEWLDLTRNGINSAKDLNDLIDAPGKGYAKMRLVYNDNPANDGFRNVALVVVYDFAADQGRARQVPDDPDHRF